MVSRRSSCSSDIDGGYGQEYQNMGSYVSRMPNLAAAMTFRIPPLQSSFPSLLHHQYEVVKEACDGWIVEVAQPPSAAACHLLLQCLLPRLICRAIPSASSAVPRLIHVTKMISWLTIADDDDDNPDVLGADDATSAQHARRVMAILRCCATDDANQSARNEPVLAALHVFTNPADHSVDCSIQLNGDFGVPLDASTNKSEKKEGALQALTKLWAEIRREMTPGVRNRFLSTMENYFQAIQVQATFRKMHRIPTMETYFEIRRQASFILPSFALLEYALGIELEEASYNNPLIDKFRTLALDYIFLCNDLISCKVEIGVGDYFNMPSIAYINSSANKESWSFQDAIDHVANMIKDVDGQCVSMLSIIQQSSLPSLQHKFVHTYIVALCSCMSGSLAWFLESARYHDPCSSASLQN